MATTPSSDQRRWAWLDWVVRIGSSETPTAPPQRVPLASLRRPASFLSTAIPLTMVIVGLALAVPSAVWAERSSSEGLGTFGVEAGAALWFGGAVALSVRRTTTVRRGLVIVMTGVVGSALIVLALAFGWSGAALALAMEFGVGALAIVVIDVIVIGAIQPGLESLARHADTASVDLQFGWRWPPVAMRIHRTTLAPDRVDGGRR